MKRNILFCVLLSLSISQTLGSGILGDTDIGETCAIDTDCVGEPNSECIDIEGELKCACKAIFIPKDDNKDCLLKATKIGDDCAEAQHQQCTANLGEFSQCGANNKCSCKAGGVDNGAGDKCLPVQNELDGACEESIQCEAGNPGRYSTCTSNKCACTDEGVRVPGEHKCFPKASKIGDVCQHNQQCTANLGESECKTDNKCGCKAGAEAENEKCFMTNTVPLEGDCEANVQCMGTSTCRSNKCACDPASQVPKGDKTDCLPVQQQLGGDCQEHLQCQAGNPGRYSTCATGKCDCTNEAVKIDGQQICFPKANKVGDTCIHPPQCTSNLGDKSECSGDENDKKCNCVADHVPNSDSTSCLAKAGYQEECEVHAQCKVDLGEHAECTDKACSCVHQSKFHADKCRALTKLGGACTENDDCVAHITGATSCVENKCVCNAGEDREDDNKCTGGTVKIGGLYLLNFVLFAVTILNYFK